MGLQANNTKSKSQPDTARSGGGGGGGTKGAKDAAAAVPKGGTKGYPVRMRAPDPPKQFPIASPAAAVATNGVAAAAAAGNNKGSSRYYHNQGMRATVQRMNPFKPRSDQLSSGTPWTAAPAGGGKIPPMQYAYVAMRRAQKNSLNATVSYEETLDKLWDSLKGAEPKTSVAPAAVGIGGSANMQWSLADANVDESQVGAAAWLNKEDLTQLFSGKHSDSLSVSFRSEEFPSTEFKGEGFRDVMLGKVEAVKRLASAEASTKHETTVKGVAVVDRNGKVIAGIVVNCCPAQSDGNSQLMPCRVWTFPEMPKMSDGTLADIIAIDPAKSSNPKVPFSVQYGAQNHAPSGARIIMETFPPLKHMRGIRGVLSAGEESNLGVWHMAHHVPVANAVVYAIESMDPRDGSSPKKDFCILIARSPVRKPAAPEDEAEDKENVPMRFKLQAEQHLQQNIPAVLASTPKKTAPVTVRKFVSNETQDRDGPLLASASQKQQQQQHSAAPGPIKPFLATLPSSSSSLLPPAPKMFPVSVGAGGGSSRRPWFGGGGVMQSD